MFQVMIKQSVLKTSSKGGGGGEWVKAKFYIGEREIIILSYLPYVIFSNLIYLTLPNLKADFLSSQKKNTRSELASTR